MLKIIVAGGRNFNDYPRIKRILDEILEVRSDVEIVCGMARGADLLGKKWADENNVQVSEFPANWDLHGKSAGYKRNAEMAKYADVLIAFWDNKSRGTEHMINLAVDGGLKSKVIKY